MTLKDLDTLMDLLQRFTDEQRAANPFDCERAEIFHNALLFIGREQMDAWKALHPELFRPTV